MGYSAVILLVLLAAYCVDRLTAYLRGDCDLKFEPAQVRQAFRTTDAGRLHLRFEAPLVNQSLREQALVIYAGAQVVPGSRESKNDDIWIRISSASEPRVDGYFEGTIIKPGKSLFVRFEVALSSEEALNDLLSGELLGFDFFYSFYGRAPMATRHVRFSIPVKLFVETREAFAAQSAPSSARRAENPGVVPVRTRMIFPGDDLVEVIRRYVLERSHPGDWVVIAESVVAITQGRLFPVCEVVPGFWARRLNRAFHYNSSLESCYSLELAIREAGLPRIILAICAGVTGRLMGRSGDFYRVAGRGVATIDDCTGTLPPFDKSIVLGPKDAGIVAAEIARKTGLDVAIVDANDLRKVDVLGKSRGIVESELIEAIRDNPQGNADEQTPIVLIRRS